MTSTFNDIVDGVSTSLAVKAPVRVASTTHLALSGLVVVEGVQTTENMRILVNAQNDAVDNGIYTAETGAWRRAKDFDGARDAAFGTTVFVVSASKFYRLVTPDPVVIGEDDINWVVTILSEEPGELQVIDTVADLRLTIAAVDGQMVGLAGYYEPGDTPFRTVWWDAASTATDDGGRVFQVTGVATGRWKSTIVDHMDIRLWGAKIDNVTDDYDAWDRALNSALRIDAVFFNTKIAGTFIFPDVGISYVSELLDIKSVISLRGDGAHIVNLASCTMRFPANSGGIQLNGHNTLGDTTVADGSGAGGSVIDGISFLGGGGATGHGVRLRCQAIINNVNVRGFAENGIHISAACGGGGNLEGNANTTALTNVRSQSNGGHGVFCDLNCANAILGTRVDGSNNGGWGIYDSSFLGNTWVGCHAADNTLGPYKKDDANARTVFVGCYSEAGQPASELMTPGLCIGGTHGAGLTAGSNMPFVQGELGFLRLSTGITVNQLDGADLLEVKLGGTPANRDILNITHATAAPFSWRMVLEDVFEAASGNVALTYSNSVANMPYLITGPGNTVFTFGRSAPVLYAMAFPKLFTAANGNGRQITHDSAAPTTGAWGRGDIVFNNGAAAGGFVGWVCVTAGSPGTWKTFGEISA